MSEKVTQIVVIAIVVLALAFYWYEWKPSQIKKGCYRQANSHMEVVGIDYIGGDPAKTYDYFYEKCLNERGF